MIIEDTTSFIVNRHKWSRGLGSKTKILDHDGNMDCLGFFLKASGFEKQDLLNIDEPIDLLRTHEWISKLIEWHGSSNNQTVLCEQIIKINDEPSQHDFSREIELIKLFATINVSLVFENILPAI